MRCTSPHCILLYQTAHAQEEHAPTLLLLLLPLLLNVRLPCVSSGPPQAPPVFTCVRLPHHPLHVAGLSRASTLQEGLRLLLLPNDHLSSGTVQALPVYGSRALSFTWRG